MSVDGAIETWSRRLARREDLPRECTALLPGWREEFPVCVHSPAIRNSLVAEPETFLFCNDFRLVVMKRSPGEVSVFQSALDAIEALEMETTLLHSCLTLHPRNASPVRLPFNTVSEHLFAPVVAAYRKARAAEVPEATQLRSLGPDPFRELRVRDCKYHAFAFRVLAGDEVKGFFHHPTEPAPELCHRSRVIPSYLLVSSSSMLYALSTRNRFHSEQIADYSLLARYIPFSSGIVLDLRSTPGNRSYRMLELGAGSTGFELPLASRAEPDFTGFARTVQRLAGQA
jgi:hypothetical protein